MNQPNQKPHSPQNPAQQKTADQKKPGQPGMSPAFKDKGAGQQTQGGQSPQRQQTQQSGSQRQQGGSDAGL